MLRAHSTVHNLAFVMKTSKYLIVHLKNVNSLKKNQPLFSIFFFLMSTSNLFLYVFEFISGFSPKKAHRISLCPRQAQNDIYIFQSTLFCTRCRNVTLNEKRNNDAWQLVLICSGDYTIHPFLFHIQYSSLLNTFRCFAPGSIADVVSITCDAQN